MTNLIENSYLKKIFLTLKILLYRVDLWYSISEVFTSFCFSIRKRFSQLETVFRIIIGEVHIFAI